MRVTVIGSGNVATHLAAALKNAGHSIVQVFSRNMQNAALLAYHVKAEPIDDFQYIKPETDMFIVSVKDDAIEAIAPKLAGYGRLIVHTSGSTDIFAIAKYTSQAGVLYPLQTFSKTKELDFWTVPLCIEGASGEVLKQIRELASTVSNHIYEVSSADRRVLHLAAVFACNFPNYLYAVAQSLLAEHRLNFDIIRPLIAETAEKTMQRLPNEVQTGPAARNDLITMDKHLQMLNNKPMLQDIYKMLSQGIIKMEKGFTGDH